jgi:antitoxin CptB
MFPIFRKGGKSVNVSDFRQVRWRCRRGMKELDVLLGRWLDTHYATVSSAEQSVFQRFLELPDPDVARYLLGREQPPDAELRALVASILAVRPSAP